MRDRPVARALVLAGVLMVPLTLFSPKIAHGQPARLLEDEKNTIEIFKKASLGVVHIDARATIESRFSMHERQGSSGTGFFLPETGYILTAFHVIQDTNQIDVILNSGRRLPARLVGTAPQLDIAVLEVEAAAAELAALPFGDSRALQPGQKVIAIGNPFGLHNAVSVGVVSAINRSVGESPVELEDALIQTDAAINPGSSGGPLLNSAGEVIGINVAIIESAENVGFAVPIHLARRVIPDLIEMGHPYRPLLGFAGSTITASIARLFGLPVDHGFLVAEVLPRNPAAAAGLEAGQRTVVWNEQTFVLGGDIITEVNGRPVTSSANLSRALLKSHPGEKLELGVLRRGRVVKLSIPLEKMKM